MVSAKTQQCLGVVGLAAVVLVTIFSSIDCFSDVHNVSNFHLKSVRRCALIAESSWRIQSLRDGLTSAVLVARGEENQAATSQSSSGQTSRRRNRDVFDLAMENAGIRVNGNDQQEVSLHKRLNSDSGRISISHVFSPYTINDEFLAVSNSWRVAKEKAAAKRGIQVELIGAVLSEDAATVPPFARTVLLTKRIPNYRRGANDVPTYGEMFSVLRDRARGDIVIYSNADIGVVPDFYIRVFDLMQERLDSRDDQIRFLQLAREEFFSTCNNITRKTLQERGEDQGETGLRELDRAVTLCARDAAVFFENLGGRPAHHPSALWKFFKTPSMSAATALNEAYSIDRPDLRRFGNAMTITRRQMPKLTSSEVVSKLFPSSETTTFLTPSPTSALRSSSSSSSLKTAPTQSSFPSSSQRLLSKVQMNETYLEEIYRNDGEDHPGNDLFVLPRSQIPILLTQTPFIHLRPAGFLIGQLLKFNPSTVFRRIMSTPDNPLTFHIGLGTDEYPVRANAQPRQVLFESAQYFTRLNITKQSFWPPPWCSDGRNYRIGGTAWFCSTTRGDFCRGWVRLSCTTYWHRTSRDTLALEHLCERVSKRLKVTVAEDDNGGISLNLTKSISTSTNEVGKGKMMKTIVARTLDEPFCSFCNEISDYPEDKKPKFRCTGAVAEECNDYPCLPIQSMQP